MQIPEERYRSAVEDIITINELQKWMKILSAQNVDDINTVYRLEMNMEE